MFEYESTMNNQNKLNESFDNNNENLNCQIYKRDKYCYMITRNKCNHKFINQEKFIQCTNCKYNFCMTCYSKGYTQVKTIAHSYFKCPSCDKVGTGLYLTYQENSCLIT